MNRSFEKCVAYADYCRVDFAGAKNARQYSTRTLEELVGEFSRRNAGRVPEEIRRIDPENVMSRCSGCPFRPFEEGGVLREMWEPRTIRSYINWGKRVRRFPGWGQAEMERIQRGAADLLKHGSVKFGRQR